jgi:Fe-S oxidoreductase
MFSEKATKNLINCRFCWMCRHLCPVGLATGRESNTPRAKGLLLDMTERGTPFSASIAEEMYHCCLCGACAEGCETGFDPRLYIREGRTQAAAMDIIPEKVQPLLDSLDQYGNIFGKPSGGNPAADFAAEKADVLLYAGATGTLKAPEMVRAAARLLKKAGVSFIAWADEPPCGAELGDLIGFTEETAASTESLRGRVQESGVTKIVALDSNHAKVMKLDYPAWNAALSAEVVTATSFFAELVKAGKLNPRPVRLPPAAYHDPSRLARDLDETQPARELLAAMGIEPKEMFLSKKMTRSTGGEVLAAHSPWIVRQMAADRWDDAARQGVSVIIASCPGSYDILSAYKPEGKEVRDIFSLLAESCGA